MRHGTAIAISATEDFIVLAADLLIQHRDYVTDRVIGTATAKSPKLRACGRDLICAFYGTLAADYEGPLDFGDGPLGTVPFKYRFDDFLPAFPEDRDGPEESCPQALARLISNQARRLSDVGRFLLETNQWQFDPEDPFLFAAIVAGYVPKKQLPEVWETVIRIDPKAKRFVYPPPSEFIGECFPYFFGSSQSIRAAYGRQEPQLTELRLLIPAVADRVRRALPTDTPPTIEREVVRVASYIGIEAKYNPVTVGERVSVIIQYRSGHRIMATV